MNYLIGVIILFFAQASTIIALKDYDKIEETSHFSLNEISKEETVCSKYIVFLLDYSYDERGETLLFIDTSSLNSELVQAFKAYENKTIQLKIGDCTKNIIRFSDLEDKIILGRRFTEFHIGGFALIYDRDTFEVFDVWPMM